MEIKFSGVMSGASLATASVGHDRCVIDQHGVWRYDEDDQLRGAVIHWPDGTVTGFGTALGR